MSPGRDETPLVPVQGETVGEFGRMLRAWVEDDPSRMHLRAKDILESIQLHQGGEMFGEFFLEKTF